MAEDYERSTVSIVRDITGHIETLIRAQYRLARVELTQEVRRLAGASVALVAGAVLVLFAIGFILLAIVRALTPVLGPAPAAVLVGVVLGILAIIPIVAGLQRLRRGISMPKTTASLQENLQWTRTHARTHAR
jgi:uncharacterized membrane protein YqjE